MLSKIFVLLDGRPTWPVSILVVVEDALELIWILLPFEVQLLPIGNPTPGGQSLLWWKMLSKHTRAGVVGLIYGVSILVVVEDALELFWTLLPFEVQLLPIGNPTPGGQSLLWWKMLSKNNQNQYTMSKLCFNPCCGGRCSRSGARAELQFGRSMFQSLLWWKMLGKMPALTW